MKGGGGGGVESTGDRSREYRCVGERERIVDPNFLILEERSLGR